MTTPTKRTAGGYWDTHFGDWTNHPVPNTLWDEVSTSAGLVLEESILSFSPTSGFSGVIPRMAENRMLRDEGETLTPAQINEQYPGFDEPVLASMTRAEADMRWTRENYRKYLRAKLEGDSPFWDLGLDMGAGIGASFLDPVNWALAAMSFGALSWVPAFKGAHGLLTAARLGHSGLKTRGAATALVGLEGLVQGAAYGSLLAASKEVGGEYWNKDIILEEALYSAGFGAALGGAVYLGGGIPAVRRGSAAAIHTMSRHLDRVLRDQRGGSMVDLGEGPVKWDMPIIRNIVAFAKGRDVDELFPKLKTATEKLDVSKIDVRKVINMRRRPGGTKMEFQQDVATGHLTVGKAGFNDVTFTGKGLVRFKGWKGDPKPFYPGMDGRPGVKPVFSIGLPDRLYVRVDDKNPPSQGRTLFFETPEGAVIEAMTSERDKVGAPSGGPYHVMEIRPPEGLQMEVMGVLNARKQTPDISSLLDITPLFSSAGRVFEAGAFLLEAVVESVSDRILTYTPGKEWMKEGTKVSAKDMFDMLNGKGAGVSEGPQIRHIMEVYYGSHYVKEGETLIYVNKQVGDMHPTDVDHNPDDLAKRRAYKMGDFRFGPTTDFLDPRWTRMDLYNVMNRITGKAKGDRVKTLSGFIREMGRLKRPDLLEEGLLDMVGVGVKFPPRVDIDSPPVARHPAVVLDEDGKPVVLGGKGLVGALSEKGMSWMGRIAEEDPSLVGLEKVKFSLPARALRLDRHPMSWGVEERVAIKGVISDATEFPVSDLFGDRTVFEKGGEGIAGWVGRSRVSLAALNINEVRWMDATGKVHSIPVEGRYRPLLQANIRNRLDELGKPEESEVAEGGAQGTEKTPAQKAAEAEQKEKETAYLDRVTNAAGEGPEEYANRLLENVGALSGRTEGNRGFRKLRKEWLGVRKKMKSLPPDSRGYQEAVRQFRGMVHDLEIMRDRLWMVWNGGLDRFGWGTDASELLALLRNSPETPYMFMGGDNVEAQWTSVQMRHKVWLIRRLEETVGEDAMALLQKGVMDRDIRRIEHWMKKKMEKDAGKTGTSTEDGREALEVSPEAWGIFNVLKEVMERGQKHVVYSGYDRPPLGEGVFIGSESWSRETMKRLGQEEFIRDMVMAADMKARRAAEIYESLTEVGVFKDGTFHTLSDMEERQHHRQIRWRSGEMKHAFLSKYGSQGVPDERGAFAKAMGIKHASTVLGDALYAIEKDAKMGAVVSTFGNRPFLTVELMGSAMKRKYGLKLAKEGVGAMAPAGTPLMTARSAAASVGIKSEGADRMLLEGQRVRIEGAVDSAVNTAGRYLTNMLLGQPAAILPMSKAVGAARALTNLNILTTAFVTAGIGDLGQAAAFMAKLEGKTGWKGLPSMWKHTFKMLGDRTMSALSPKQRKRKVEIGHRMALAFTKDMEDMSARIDESAGTGFYVKAQNVSMKGLFLPAVTDIGRGSSAMWASMGMGESMLKPYGRLSEIFAKELNIHGIGEPEWELVRGLGIARTEDGVPMFYLDVLHSALYEAEVEGKLYKGRAEEIYGKFETFVADFVRMKTSPQTGMWEATVLSPNRDGDDWTNRAIRLVTQYLGVAMRQSRDFMSIASPREHGKRVGMMHRNMAAMMVHATMLGGVAVMLKSWLRGKTLDPTENYHNFILRSMVQSGALGLYGDYLLGEANPDKMQLASKLLGPTISGPGTEAMAVTANFFTGSWDKIPGNAWDLIRKLLPSVTGLHHLVLNTLFLEHFGAMSGDAKSRGAVRSRMNEIGESFIAE